MKLKNLLRILIACALVLSLTVACGDADPVTDGTGPAKTDDTGNNAGNDKPGEGNTGGAKEGFRDLNGLEVIIGQWWAVDEWVNNPTSQFGEDRLYYRQQFQKDHNLTVYRESISDWSSNPDIIQASILSGEPRAQVFTVDARHAMGLFRNNLFYPVSELPTFSDSSINVNWNHLIAETMTFNDVTYGFASGYEPRNGIFFNKDVLESAGFDPNLPYDLQASGEWTWDKFMEICEQVTRDEDGDGETDIYGLTTFHSTTLIAAVASNGARFVSQDENGLFMNTSNSVAFLEASQFVYDLMLKGLVQPSREAEGAEWNWYIEAFNEGKSAFRADEENCKSELKNVSFDWGFVYFPMGPKMDGYVSVYNENVCIIPSSYSAEIADDILFAFAMYEARVPGYEDDEDYWKYDMLTAYRDRRAIDETVAPMREGLNGVLRLEAYVSNFNVGDIAYSIWNMEKTPAQLIEEAKQVWDQTVTDANTRIQKALNN